MLWWTLQKLKASDNSTRAEAARSLATSGNSKAVPALIKALGDDHEEVRIAVIESLGAFSHPAGAEAIANALRILPQRLKQRRKEEGSASGLGEYQALANALARIGPPSLNPLLPLLEAEDKDTRRWAASAVGALRDSKALSPLVARLEDSRSEVRQAAARALGMLGDAGAVQPLMKTLGGRDNETRCAAAEALGSLGALGAVEALGLAAQDANQLVQLAALQALGRIGGLRAGFLVRAALEDSGRKAFREAAIRILKSMQFEDSSAENRAAGAVLRGEFDVALREGPAAKEALTSALNSKETTRRMLAVRALQALGSEHAVPGLLGSLDDNDRAVQEAAAEALGFIGGPAIPGLLEALKSNHVSVRGLAARVLGRIGDPAAVHSLAVALNDYLRSSASEPVDQETAREVISALRRIVEESADRISSADLEGLCGVTLANAGHLVWQCTEIGGDAGGLRELATLEIRRRAFGVGPTQQ